MGEQDRIEALEALARQAQDKLNAAVVDNGWVSAANMKMLADGLVEAAAEVKSLRHALAYEAAVVEAQTGDVKALGKGRRRILSGAISRMRRTAVGQYAYHGVSFQGLGHAMGQAEALASGADHG